MRYKKASEYLTDLRAYIFPEMAELQRQLSDERYHRNWITIRAMLYQLRRVADAAGMRDWRKRFSPEEVPTIPPPPPDDLPLCEPMVNFGQDATG